MGLLSLFYRIRHPRAQKTPNTYRRSLLGQLWHTIRKAICQNIAPNCVTNFMRVNLYRLCGFKIGKGTFIGMKCYLDDLRPDLTIIGNNCTICQGVYFAVHGRKQKHANKVIILDGANIGMRAIIIARTDIVIGENAVIGACTLVNKSVPPRSDAEEVPYTNLDKKENE